MTPSSAGWESFSPGYHPRNLKLRRKWVQNGWTSGIEPPAVRKRDSSPGGLGHRTLAGGNRDPNSGYHRRQDARHQAVRSCLRAGYWARCQNVDLEAGVYVTGPLAGCPVVDPFVVARQIRDCQARWGAVLGRDRRCHPQPRRCKSRLCPVCAHVLAEERTDRLLRVLEADFPSGVIEFITLTQRAHPRESVLDARRRFMGALRRLFGGRPGRRLRAALGVDDSWGAVLQHEVTESWDGKHQGAAQPPAEARWVHFHVHILLVHSGETSSRDLASRLGSGWRQASEQEASAQGIPGYGWDPVSGGCRIAADGSILDPNVCAFADRDASSWWKTVGSAAAVGSGDDVVVRAVSQVCKYFTSSLAKGGTSASRVFVASCLTMKGKRTWFGKGAFVKLASRAAELKLEAEDAKLLGRATIGVPAGYLDEDATSVTLEGDGEGRFDVVVHELNASARFTWDANRVSSLHAPGLSSQQRAVLQRLLVEEVTTTGPLQALRRQQLRETELAAMAGLPKHQRRWLALGPSRRVAKVLTRGRPGDCPPLDRVVANLGSERLPAGRICYGRSRFILDKHHSPADGHALMRHRGWAGRAFHGPRSTTVIELENAAIAVDLRAHEFRNRKYYECRRAGLSASAKRGGLARCEGDSANGRSTPCSQG